MNKVKAHYTDPFAYYKISDFLKKYIDDKTIIICIGTDRCIGDCLGPLVGSYLKDSNIPLKVFGTIDSPIHALNIDEKFNSIKSRYPDYNIMGIDACLGDEYNIGEIQVRDYPIHPGKGVGKDLPKIGKVSIIGIVDSCNKTELFTNRNIRLNLIIKISKVITKSILHAYSSYLEESLSDS